MKKVMVTSCSQSQGRPAVRVTMSHMTVTVKPVIATPQSTISTPSSGSRARHLRCRCDCWTSERRAGCLFHVAHEVEDLHCVRAEIVGELVLDGLARRLEA